MQDDARWDCICAIDHLSDREGFVRKKEGGVFEEMQAAAAVLQLVNQQIAALA